MISVCASLLPGFLNESWQNLGYLLFNYSADHISKATFSIKLGGGALNLLVIYSVQAQQINHVSRSTHPAPPSSSLKSHLAELQPGKKWDTRPFIRREEQRRCWWWRKNPQMSTMKPYRVRGTGVGSYCRRKLYHLDCRNHRRRCVRTGLTLLITVTMALVSICQVLARV